MKTLKLVRTFFDIGFFIYLPDRLGFLFFSLSLISNLTPFKEKKRKKEYIYYFYS